MQATLKGPNPPSGHPSRNHHHFRQNFCSIALLVARRSTLRQIGPLPPVAPKVSHFFSFGKDCRYPDESAAESTRGNQAAMMYSEAKFSKISQFTHSKEPAGRIKPERRVAGIEGGLPMDSKYINFRVAGLVKRGGFV